MPKRIGLGAFETDGPLRLCCSEGRCWEAVSKRTGLVSCCGVERPYDKGGGGPEKGEGRTAA